MITATALMALHNKNGEVIGYRIQDNTGKTMDASVESIKNALKTGAIIIYHLKMDGDKLMFNNDESLAKINQAVNNTSDTQQTTIKVADNKYTGSSDIDRIKYLVKLLNQARLVYEQGKDEIMSNHEYDSLYDELTNLEHKTGCTLNNSPTVNIGSEVVSSLPKRKHSKPMQSLTKTKSLAELISFADNKETVLSWKMDGLTVVLTYNGGVLTDAVTRGDGVIGEFVLPNAKQFSNLPKTIPFKGKLELRGEPIITYTNFNRINSLMTNPDDLYKNPRNLCSGSVRQLDSSITKSRKVEWYCFDLVSCEGLTISNMYDKQLEFVKSLGFEVVQHTIVHNAAELEMAVLACKKYVEDKKIDIPVDGLVLTYKDRAYGNSLGSTAKAPRHSKAFKWEDTEVATILRDISWQTSRNGKITPVAMFDTVEVEGSNISKASLHNVSIFKELELGYGDTITVFKANMIIPQVYDNLSRTGTCRIPDVCPCCGAETELHQDPYSGVYTLWCTNDNCDAKGSKLLKHFVSRDAMNIDGISGATINTLLEYNILSDFASIFRIKEHTEIMAIEGFGSLSFTNMVRAVEKARTVKLANLIYALSIPNIGLNTSKLICEHFGNNIQKVLTADYYDLCNIEGIGDVIAHSFISWFKDTDNFEEFKKLYSELNIVQEEVAQADSTNPIYGKTFCVTGSVHIYNNRKEVEDDIRRRGGKLTTSVSGSTSYLITNDKTSGSAKNINAAKYGIPILSEQEFIDNFINK